MKRETNSNFTSENIQQTTLTKWSKLTAHAVYVTSQDCGEKEFHLFDIFLPNQLPQCNHE